jgi:hypothetical protein
MGMGAHLGTVAQRLWVHAGAGCASVARVDAKNNDSMGAPIVAPIPERPTGIWHTRRAQDVDADRSIFRAKVN